MGHQQSGGGVGNMMWVLAQMFRLPLTAFVYTIEVFITSMRGIQETTDQVMDVTLGGGTQTLGHTENGGKVRTNDGSEALKAGASLESTNLNQPQPQKEQSEMEDRDIDLRGDDLKLLEYDIWFTKADLQAYLAGDKEVITYSTTLSDYKGSKKSTFSRELFTGPGKRPQRWLDNDYPPAEYRSDENGNQADNGAYYTGLPQGDEDEFLKVDVRLIGRREKDEKDESDRLKDINRTLQGTLKVRPV